MNKELIERAKKAASPDELIELAKEKGRELSPERAEEIFKAIHQSGELSDDELSDAVGGCGGGGGGPTLNDLWGFNLNCPKGGFHEGHIYVSKSYWCCAICGEVLRSKGPLDIEYCSHVFHQLGKNLGCHNCGYHKGGSCDFWDDSL